MKPKVYRMFSDDEVRAIRKDRRSAREVAKDFGCSHVHVVRIRNRDAYAEVSDIDDMGLPSPTEEQLTASVYGIATIKALIRRAETKEIKMWLFSELLELEEETNQNG